MCVRTPSAGLTVQWAGAARELPAAIAADPGADDVRGPAGLGAAGRAERVVVPEGPGGTTFAALLAGSPVTVEQSPDFRTAAWRKLLVMLSEAVAAATAPGGPAPANSPATPAPPKLDNRQARLRSAPVSAHRAPTGCHAVGKRGACTRSLPVSGS